MDDAVAAYREASEANDIEGLLGALASDAELQSPVASRMVFRGIRRIRPWLALSLFALILLVKVGAHPGVVLRAARG